MELTDELHALAVEHYVRKSDLIASTAFPVIKDVFENQGAQYENIVVPITDGIKTINITTPLEKTFNSNGKELIKAIEKSVVLALIDEDWKEHLREMDELKQSVQNASYEQKDPLLIYKFEAFKLFNEVLLKINKEVASFLMKCSLPQQQGGEIETKAAQEPQKSDLSELQTSRPETVTSSASQQQGMPPQEQPKTQPVRVEKKVGRNEPCPCGSGKKYKQCHGKNG